MTSANTPLCIISTTAADHHSECHRNQDHLRRLQSLLTSLQQRRGRSQAGSRVQLGPLGGQALRVGHPEDLHDGGRDRPQHRAHGGGLFQRLRASGEGPGGAGRVRRPGLSTVHQQLGVLGASLPHKVPAVWLCARHRHTAEQRRPGGH